MPKLIFIRHSMVEIDRARPSREWSLSEGGRARCRQLVPALAVHHPTRIITSEETKAVETGQILADKLGLSCHAVPNLHEHNRIGVPYFESQKAFQAIIAQLFRQPDELIFGSETANEARNRFGTAVGRLLRQYPQETLAIVTHGTVLTLFLAQHNQFDSYPFWQSIQLPDFFAVHLPDFRLVTQ